MLYEVRDILEIVLFYTQYAMKTIKQANISCLILNPQINASFILDIVDLWVPEESLVAITPRVWFRPDVQVWELWFLTCRRSMSFVFPMFIPECVGIGTEDDKARNHNIDRGLSPEVCAFSGVSSYSSTLTIERIVGWLPR